MALLNLGTTYTEQDGYASGGRIVNLFAEQDGDMVSLRPRPSLALRYTLGSGPIRAILSTSSATYGDAVFSISGLRAYKDSTYLGTMTGHDMATISSSGDEIVFTLGGLAYVYDWSTFTQIAMPDSALVSSAAFLAGRFYYQVADSDQWYFSAIYDAATIDGLAFATAEANPDSTKGVAVLGDEVWFFGEKTIEPWYVTGDASAPLQRAQGRVFPRGCASQSSISSLDNTLFWLGYDGNVYRASNVPQVVSTPAISAKIKQTDRIDECAGFTTIFSGHEFYVLFIPNVGSYAFDVSTGMWSEWASYDQVGFRVSACAHYRTDAYLGDRINGNVYYWSTDTHLDNGAAVERVCYASAPTIARGGVNTNVTLKATYGTAAIDVTNHVVEMRYSDDGRTWSDWAIRDLGATGWYRDQATWWRLGVIGPRGRDYEFRTTSPIVFSPSFMTINEVSP